LFFFLPALIVALILRPRTASPTASAKDHLASHPLDSYGNHLCDGLRRGAALLRDLESW
jgi:hypothetical protein